MSSSQGQAISKTSDHVIAGFASGLTTSVLLQPLDLLKTRVQQEHGSTLRGSLKEINSLKQLWKGTLTSVVRTSCGSALYFPLLNLIRSEMHTLVTSSDPGGNNRIVAGDNDKRRSSNLPRLGMFMNLASGALARSAAGLLVMPVTVVKVRVESTNYKTLTVFSTVASIYRDLGIRGFYKGYGVTLLRDAPYAGLYVLLYEKNKDIISKLIPATVNINAASINSMAAITAAGLATCITGPLDTVKTRIQLDPIKYGNFSKALAIVIKEGGLLRLFDGLSLRLSRKALSSGVAWTLYEEILRRTSVFYGRHVND